MTTTLADILWYFDAARKKVTPTIGGEATFVRAANAITKQDEAHYLIGKTNTPRFEPDGLLLELSQTNKIIAGTGSNFNVDPADANWAESGNFTTADVTSLFVGETGKKHTNPNDAADRYLAGTLTGNLTANPETSYVIAEKGNQAITSVALVDTDAPGLVSLNDFTWATGASSVSSPVGSAETGESKLLAEVGPSGGEVRKIWVTVTPGNPGNARQLRVYPSGRTQNGEIGIIHAAQHVDAGLFTSPVDGVRVTDICSWDDPPIPIDMIIYAKWISVLNLSGGITNPMVWHIGTTGVFTGTSFMNYVSTAGKPAGLIFDGGAGNRVVTADGVVLAPGDTAESVIVLDMSNGNIRIIARKNGGAVSSEGGAPGAWAPFTEWDIKTLTFNSTQDGSNKGAISSGKFVAVTAASVDSAIDGSGTGDEDLMAEMAGLRVSHNGLVVSNAT